MTPQLALKSVPAELGYLGMQVCIARQSVSKSITTEESCIFLFLFCFGAGGGGVCVLWGGIKSDITTYVEIKSV